MNHMISNRLLLLISILAVFINAGCGGATSQTLLYQLDHQIWKQYEDGTGKVLLIQNGERPRWIPGTKTHFAYIERKGGTPNVKLWVADVDGKNPVALTNFEIASEYSWSPDGKWIAVSHTKDGNYEIYKIKTDGSQLIRLTNNPYTDRYPRWNLQGDKIAFVTNRSGHDDIFVINADGTGEKKLSEPSHIGDDDSPSWSFDGKKLAFVAKRGTDYHIKTVEVASGKIDQITQSGINILPHYEDIFILYLTQLGTSYTLKRYDTQSGTTNSLVTYNTYTNADVLTSNAAYVFTIRQNTSNGPSSIYRTQHYTGDTVDLGPGREPDDW